MTANYTVSNSRTARKHACVPRAQVVPIALLLSWLCCGSAGAQDAATHDTDGATPAEVGAEAAVDAGANVWVELPAGQPPDLPIEVPGLPPGITVLTEPHQFSYLKSVLELSQIYTIGIVGITMLTLLVVLVVLLRSQNSHRGWTRMNLAALVLPLVIGGALAMVSSGFSREQMLAPMTLFGTIIGYLLGNISQDSRTETKAEAPKDGGA